MSKAGACIWSPNTSALLKGKFILGSFAIFLVGGGWFFLCPSFTVFSPLTSSFFYVYPLAGWSCHSASQEKYWSIWSWSSCPGRSYRGLFMFFWYRGEMLPLLYILFWEIVILSGFTRWRFLLVISSPTYHREIPLENTARLLAKQEESFTKFSNILSIWNCCHSCLHLSSEEGKLPQAK